MSTNPKAYVGDAVYVEWDGYHITLTTEDGYRATNTIHLEPGLYERIGTIVEELKTRRTQCLKRQQQK